MVKRKEMAVFLLPQLEPATTAEALAPAALLYHFNLPLHKEPASTLYYIYIYIGYIYIYIV